jgi:hypothetical protein
MKDELEKLIESKKRNDKKQRTISLVIISVAIALIFFIFYSITQKQKANETLSQTLDTTKLIITKKDSAVKRLNETLTTVRKEVKNEVIECIGVPTKTTTAEGLQKYNFTFRIKDRSLISELIRVDYYFNDVTYHPKLKTSVNSQNNFSISIPNSWGCMNIVPVYLHYKDNRVDTVLFSMCDKAKIILPRI